MDSVRAAMVELGIDVAAETARGALRLVSGQGAYVVHGSFNPETTLQIFNDAIEQAYRNGFTGFRAAADMSWALDCEDAGHQVIVYEALLKSLFASCRATGLCLYDRTRMPLSLLDGALRTHPIAGSPRPYATNPFYDADFRSLAPGADSDVRARLAQFDRSGHTAQGPFRPHG
jgi:hypothetical protein